MRVAISYPPIINKYGQKAMVSQNRNVQFFKKPTYLLPITYAQAATWLRNEGHEVLWDDGNAQLKSYETWLLDLVDWSPDVVIFESTTPVMKFYWRTTKIMKIIEFHMRIIKIMEIIEFHKRIMKIMKIIKLH